MARTNADPRQRERQLAGVRAHAAKPETKAALTSRLAAHLQNLSPAELERRREQGRHIAATVLARPDVRAKSNSPEAKAKAGRARPDTVLAWCPPAYRERYRFLKKTKLLRADEAKRVVLDEVAADERRRAAAAANLTPFERQMEAVRNGARLVAKPDTRPAGPSQTLGGVSSGML